MGYLFIQILFWLVVAAALGLLIGWLIWGRRQASKPDMSAECDRLRGSLSSVRADLATCREKLAAAEAANRQPEPEVKPEPPQADEQTRSVASAAVVQAPEPKPEPEPAPVVAAVEPPPPSPADLSEDEQAPDDWKPILLTEPQGEKDDLKRIKGVGPKIEGILNNLGIYHFSQIAAFTEENIAWVNGYLKFKGRIQREKWIDQAKQLAAEK